MKADMVIEIFPGKKVCTDESGRDCQFFEERSYTCGLFQEPLQAEQPSYNPLRCQDCLNTFEEDEE